MDLPQIVKGVTPRCERKYLIQNSEVSQALHWIYFHPYGFSETFSSRDICTMYLDTQELDCAQAVIQGFNERAKFRWRWYDSLEPKKNIQLEVKVRNNSLIYKKIYMKTIAASFSINELFSPERELLNDLDNEIYYLLSFLKPSAFTRYKRHYFMDLDKKIRLTLDTSLHYQAIIGNSFTFIPKTPDTTLLLELKYHPDSEIDVRKIAARLPTLINRHSKYLHGVFS